MLRVKITDKDALYAIEPFELALYLTRNGWSIKEHIYPSPTTTIDVFSNGHNEILLAHRRLGDYINVIERILEILERAENRSQLVIYRDIVGNGQFQAVLGFDLAKSETQHF